MSQIDHASTEHLRALASDATLAVREQLLDAFRSGVERDFKLDFRDIVTEHDRAAEDRISEFLLKREPGSEVVGEEHGSRGSGRLQWIVDPIDGTANFACGLPSWCVSIGAVIDDDIVAGAILDPMGGNLFSANLTEAFLGKERMISTAQPDEQHATLISSYPSARDLRMDGREIALNRFGTLVDAFSSVRRNGSAALGIAHVAAGWADAAMGFGVNAWDVAAAIRILRNAGGTYTPRFTSAPDADARPQGAKGYTATGGGARYPTLETVAEAIATDRRETVHA